MGRVTVFGSDECPYCTRAKAGLKLRDIPFTEIDLVQHPYRRNDMLSLTNEYSIPQIFIDDQHIGGADELLDVLDEIDEHSDEALSSLDAFQQRYGSNIDPKDPRLRAPTLEEEKRAREAQSPSCYDPIGYRDTLVDLPNGEQESVFYTTNILDAILDIRDRTFNARTYLNCFINVDAVAAIVEHFDCTREEAVVFAKELQKKYKIIDHVSGKHEFCDGGCYYFRLQCYSAPQILNSYRVWTRPVKPECANMILLRLRKLLGQILESHTDDEDGLVDYIEARKDDRYPVFEEAVCVVQAMDMSEMDEHTRLSFGLNLYNLMISYAFVKMGIATTSTGRNSFFNKVKFNVGGHVLSFNDLENGVLRANTRHPYAMSVPFGKDDPRLTLSLSELDCRVHFGLNCGAKSCPPVKYFRAESIDEELRVVSLSFCEKDATCFVDEAKHELHLSMLMKWFEKDFLKSKEEKIADAVLRFLTGEKHNTLERMIKTATDENKPITVKYLPYDWSVNASRFMPFKIGKSDKFNPQALLRFEGKWNMRSKTPAIAGKSLKVKRKKNMRRASAI